MLVTDDRVLGARDPVELAVSAVRGGVTMVQLRLKAASARELADLAKRLKARLTVPVLVNDRPDVAAVARCGVHLGPDDVPVELARRILPPGSIIGSSVGTAEESGRGAGADFWGVGPWRITGTKGDAGEAIGAAGFGRVVALANGKPCIAIGGIRSDDVGEVLAAGGVGVAVVSGILAADEVEAAARSYASMWASWLVG
jgi:thiamine-phosphate pyrophosphorylase